MRQVHIFGASPRVLPKGERHGNMCDICKMHACLFFRQSVFLASLRCSASLPPSFVGALPRGSTFRRAWLGRRHYWRGKGKYLERLALGRLPLEQKTARRVNPREKNEGRQAALILGPRCVPCWRRAQGGAQIWAPFSAKLARFFVFARRCAVGLEQLPARQPPHRRAQRPRQL